MIAVSCTAVPPLPLLPHTHTHTFSHVHVHPPTPHAHTHTHSDIAIGAPYVDMGSNNQGSVYIYYGRADIVEFGQQIPFEVQ